jgi:hypothetical protein
MAADLKSDKRGLALAVMRKRRLVAQTVVLLDELAHKVLDWAQDWLAKQTLRLPVYDIVRPVDTGVGRAGAGQARGGAAGTVASPASLGTSGGSGPARGGARPWCFWARSGR